MYHVILVFNVYIDAVMKGAKWGWEGGERVKIDWPLLCK